MKLDISGKNLDLGKALPTRIAEKLKTMLNKYFTNVTDVSLVIEKQRENFRADLHIHVNKIISITATGECKEAYGAFENALKHAAKRLRRSKKKQYISKHRP